jgi:ankyrin repeat protein
MTALHPAASNGHVDVCRYMAEDCGLDIEATTSCLNTSLSLASMDGRIEVCKYLLENGARVGAGIHLLIGASQV